MEKVKVDTFDVEQLASYISGLDYDEIDANTSIIEETLIDKFGCDLQQFEMMIEILLPLIDVGSSPLTQKRYKGFAEDSIWFVKTEL